MKRGICIMLISVCILASFSACTDGKPQATSLISTEETTPIPTEDAKWKPYDGNTEEYVYYYDEGANRLWEEDLLYLADLYLQTHALLTPEESRVSYRNGVVWDGYYTDEMYQPETREAFLAVFNETIPQLESMNKTEFILSAQRMLATLSDAHAYLDFPYGEKFPCSVILDDGAFYVVGIPSEHKELLFSRLVSINGVDLEEVIDALRPYTPYENEHCLFNSLTKPGYMETLFSVELLKFAGVLQDTRPTNFVFEMEDGTLHTVELEPVSHFDGSHLWDSGVYPYESLMFDNADQDYWYTMLDGIPYFRISDFNIDESDIGKPTLMQVGNELLAEVRDMGGAETMIVDLRGNGGGAQVSGYHEAVSVLDRMKLETIYVLIDGSSFSQTVFFATYLKQELENVVLVGTPAAQSPNFFGTIESYNMPNTQTRFVLATEWWMGWEGYEHDALMPDIIVEQKMQDYKDGRDAVLAYVLDATDE